jgi:hypothetical protein
MPRWAFVIAIGIMSVAASASQAARTVTTRAYGQHSNGARSDITVPYTTTGRSAFMSGVVAPRIYSSPSVNDARNPQAKPVFNLPFYGAKQGFGDKSNGATPR